MKKWMITAAACAVFAVGCSASGGGSGAPSTDTTERQVDTTTTTETERPTTTERDIERPTTSTTEKRPQKDKGGKGSKKSDPLKIGETGSFGEWEVKVVEVIPEASKKVKELDEYAEAPKNGQYLYAKIEATYVGDEEGSPRSALRLAVSGKDGVQYDDTGCTAYVDAQRVTLEPGAKGTIQKCIDAPPETIKTGVLFVEDEYVYEADVQNRGYWDYPKG